MHIWLDDERNPKDPNIQRGFKATGDEIWVKTAEEAIRLLETGKVLSISLDFELGTYLTGLDVAKYIEQAASLRTIPKLHVFFHSHSIEGVKLMKEAIRNAYKSWLNYE